MARRKRKRERLASFSIEEVRRLAEKPIWNKGKPYFLFGEQKVSLRRILVHFQIGLRCVKCGRQGGIYHLDYASWDGYHLDLYSEDGVLMTIDHACPRSRGGKNSVRNYQMMCCECNYAKADSIS